MLLDTMIKFANLQRITSTRQVEELFRRVPLVGPVFQTLKPHEAAAYEKDQDRLLGWLRAIAAGNEVEVSVVAHEVEATLSRVLIHVRPHFNAARRELRAMYALGGVEAAYAYGTALLLARSAGLGARLGHCTAPRCDRFNLDLEKRVGRPKRYCSTPHYIEANEAQAAKRMRDKRAADRKRDRASRERTTGKGER